MQAAEAFRDNVRSELNAQNLSISALARAAGIQQANMSRILSGSESVTLQRAERISEALGKRLSELLESHAVASN